MYLLDTNVVSELRKPRPHGGVIAWVKTIVDTDLHLSSVTLGEIQAGIEITRERDTVKAEEIEAWLEQVSSTFNILPMDAATFRCWATLMHKQQDSLYEDAMIAATGIIHHLTIVTRNIKDFERFKVKLFNPFESNEYSL